MVINSSSQVHFDYVRQLRDIGVLFKPIPNTTLNEKFEHHQDIQLEPGEYPELKYFSISVGGVERIKGTKNYSYSKHKSIDGALFNHVPFIMKPLDEDISEKEQARYRFRKIVTVDGVDYASYYLKNIETFIHNDFYYEISGEEGKKKLTKYNHNNEDILNPKPLDKSAKVMDLDTKYIAAIYKAYFILSKQEIDNLLDVFKILKLDTKHITEIGVCSGFDKSIDDKIVATNVQLAYVVGVDLSLTVDLIDSVSKELVDLYIEIGGSEPNVG